MVNYNELLYEKVKQEYDEFIDGLEKLAPKEIIQHSYEKVFKEDITMCFEDINLDERDAKALFKKKKPLDFVYNEWVSNDFSYMESLRDTIDDSCKKAVRDFRIMSRDGR